MYDLTCIEWICEQIFLVNGSVIRWLTQIKDLLVGSYWPFYNLPCIKASPDFAQLDVFLEQLRLVSYCIMSLVNVGRLLGHLLWLTGKCVQLNWSSILLDGYKKLSLPEQPSRKALLVRRPKSVKTVDSAVGLHRAGTPARDISIALYLSSFLLLVSLLF